MKYFKRIRLFFGIMWRYGLFAPVYGPYPLRERWRGRVHFRTAWWLASTVYS